MLIICVAKPILLGIYENNSLIQSYTCENKASESLAKLCEKALKNYDIKEFIYTNSPGSYMSIKFTYVFLKALCLVKNAKLSAVLAFEFNNQTPIKALAKKYFKLQNDKIYLDFLGEDEIQDFILPQNLSKIKRSEDTLPRYILAPV